MSDLTKKIEGSETIMSEFQESMYDLSQRFIETESRLKSLSEKAGVFGYECKESMECIECLSPENIKQGLNYMLNKLRDIASKLEKRATELETFI